MRERGEGERERGESGVVRERGGEWSCKRDERGEREGTNFYPLTIGTDWCSICGSTHWSDLTSVVFV